MSIFGYSFIKKSIQFLIVSAFILTLMVTLPAFAQQTQSEEAERRAKVLETLPAHAAKRHFGSVKQGAGLEGRSIGSYARGCVAGATALPVDGETWQVMRLSRNRMWGHPDLISFLEKFSKAVPRRVGWNGILVGDISQPRGGPMLTGHASHQVGLDADIWFTPMPNHRLSNHERENISATNIVADDFMDINPQIWDGTQTKILKLASDDPRVARIFVNPAIKKALCRDVSGDRSWLSKIRPMYGHNYHFHIRMVCPEGSESCSDQDPPPESDGCDASLEKWFAELRRPKRPPSNKAAKPAPALPLSAMPQACQELVLAR